MGSSDANWLNESEPILLGHEWAQSQMEGELHRFECVTHNIQGCNIIWFFFCDFFLFYWWLPIFNYVDRFYEVFVIIN